jgi:Uma2 family endonuclease
MAQLAQRLLTVEEFLEDCPDDGRHYQLIDGRVVAMNPPGSPHQVIAGILTGEIYTALRRTRPGCFLRPQAGFAPLGLQGRDHFEADLAATCSPPQPADRGMIRDAFLVVEILSPSNDRDDVTIKLPVYQGMADLREILYVETETVAATVWRRGNDRAWLRIPLNGAEDRLVLDTVGLDIPLGALYPMPLP